MESNMADPDVQCGIGKCRPKPFHVFTNILTFTLLYSFSGLFTSTNSVYLSSQITTLEKFFGFSSTQTGFLMSCNDIGFLTTTLFASYNARRWHIPRVLSMGGVLFGVSGIICSLSYFLSPMSHKSIIKDSINNTKYNSLQGGHMCQEYDVNISRQKCLNEFETEAKIGISTEFTPVAMTILAIALIIQGICKSPRQPFVTTYIDDNVDKTQTAFYMGLTFALLIFGPAIAFGVGGVFSKMYVSLQDVDISPTDPRWIGAWWLGFVIFGGSAIVASIPILFFPRRLHSKKAYDKAEKQTFNKENPAIGWLKAVRRLFTNPIYILSVLNVCIGAFVLAGFSTFMPKYVETQFTLPAWQANVILGLVAILSACLGAFLGGLVTSKLKLSPLGCLKFVIITNTIGLLISVLFCIFGCPNPDIVGFNSSSDLVNTTCINNCACDDKDYFVICGSDGRNYFSPCHAGCTGQLNKLYVNCSCIDDGGSAIPGKCDTKCSMLYPFIALMLVTGFLSTISAMPSLIFLLRSVSDRDKAMAVGISTFLQTLVGYFPGPIVVGKIVDTTCIIWAQSCSKVGACSLYDNDQLRIRTGTIIVVCRFFIFILTLVLLCISRSKTDWSTESTFQISNKKESKRFLDNGTDLPQSEDLPNEELLPRNGTQSNELKTFK